MSSEAGYHHGDLPAALLRAVAEIVAEDGVGTVSVRAVARRAGVSHAAPAHHFGDRGGLLAAYAADGFLRLHGVMSQAIDTLPADATVADAMLAIGRAYIAFGVEDHGVYNVMFRPELVDCTAPRLVHAGACAFGVLLAVTRACLDEDATDEDVIVCAMAAWSTIHGFLSLQLDLPTADVEHLPPVSPLLEPVLGLALAGLGSHPRWVGSTTSATAIPTDRTDPLAPEAMAELPEVS